MKTEKKKVDPRAKPAPPRFNPRVMRVKFFLRVENINPPRKKMRVMRVDPAGSTRFAISTYKAESTQDTFFTLF